MLTQDALNDPMQGKKTVQNILQSDTVDKSGMHRNTWKKYTRLQD